MKKHSRTLIAIALMAGMAFLASIYALQGCLLTSMIDHYGLTDFSQGLASSMQNLGGVLALITSFLLIGKLPKLTLLRIAVAVSAVFLALLKFAPGFAAFVGIWLIIGIGMGYIDTLLSACMADLYEGRAATRMMCLLHTCFGLTSMIVPLGFNAMLSGGVEWRSTYLTVSAFGFALLVYFAVIMRASGKTAVRREEGVRLADMKQVFTGTALPMLIAAMFCHGMFLTGMNTWINRYVDITLNCSIKSMAFSSMFTGLMVCRLVVSFVHIDTKKYVGTAGFISAVIFAVAIVLKNGMITTVAVAVCGLCFGAMIPCMLDIACTLTPRNTMLATSGMMLALYIGQVITSPLIGALESAFSLHAGMMMCAVFMALTSFCCRLAGKKL